MTPAAWLRALGVIFILFSAGHTAGVVSPPSHGPAVAVYETMQRVRFPAMGFERTYGEFYLGFGLFVSAAFLILAALAFQLAAVSRRHPAEVWPMAVTLLVGCLASAVLSWRYFFIAPIVMSVAAVAVAAGAVAALRRASALRA